MKQTKLWMLAAILVCGTNILTSCTSDNDDNPVVPTDEVEAQLQKMTLREKVGQLFYVRPECLDTTIHFNLPSSVDVSSDDIREIKLQAVTATMRGVNEKYPVGGVILYAHNIDDEAQLSAFISQIRALNGSPLLCIDEEGGRVARIANNANFDVEKFESMEAIGATGDPQNAYYCANTIGTYLHRYGFDIDFAPVADVNTNPENIIITDAMEMGAITLQYTNAEAAVGTLQAGADIVLGPQNFVEAFDAVVKAVEDDVLTEQRIDQSVRRILKLKRQIKNKYNGGNNR